MTPYQAYGFRLVSDLVIPELSPVSCSDGDSQPVLIVRLNIARHIRFDPDAVLLRTDNPDGQEWLVCAKSSGGFVLRFVGTADFFVNESGDIIECCWIHDATSPDTLRHLVLDAVIPRVLDLRGFEPIHATAASIDGAACAFLGPTGAGKSTLATNFALAGAPLLGDDCVVLSVTNTDAVLTPGYAGARLWGDSFDALGIGPSESEIVADCGSKRRVPELGCAFSAVPQPLKRIYRLSRPGENAEQVHSPALEEMRPAESLIELASASYRFNPTDRVRNLRKFEFLKKIVALVPMRRLIVPNDFAMLCAVRNLILADLAGPVSANMYV